MKIPYSALRSKPVEIEIHDLLIVLGPSLLSEMDANAEEAWFQADKKNRLASLESLEAKVGFLLVSYIQSQQETGASSSEPSTLLDLIIDNIRLEIHNVHIRYEDNITHPSHPFAFGITLKTLLSLATDDKGTPRCGLPSLCSQQIRFRSAGGRAPLPGAHESFALLGCGLRQSQPPLA